MLLSDLLNNLRVKKIFQTRYGKSIPFHDIQINKIEYDSRNVTHGDLFVAIRGNVVDGHKYIPDALAKGALVVILEDDTLYPDYYFMHNDVAKIVVENSRQALAVVAASYYRYPAKKLQMIGVTGTNGKTTTTYILKSIIENYAKSQNIGGKVGLIGTIANLINDKQIPSSLTTPESLELQKLLADFYDGGAKWVIMEVSSHSLVQQRVYGIDFRYAIFTNLTPEHLDYHGDMESYFQAKKILFDNLVSSAYAVSNFDDIYGKRILADTKATKFFYGLNEGADIFASDIQMSFENLKFKLHYGKDIIEIETPLVGKFNVYNCLAAVSVALLLGIDFDIIIKSLKTIKLVNGRFETLRYPNAPIIIIDYAHTPDALEKCLNTVKDIITAGKNYGRIITVFGAGGDRDKTKRPIMGKVVSQISDLAVVTSDNPRTEDPKKIIDDILSGISNTQNIFIEVDRKKAIEKALEIAQNNDVILIAGKGHEEYQIIGQEKIKFSDREVVASLIGKNK